MSSPARETNSRNSSVSSIQDAPNSSTEQLRNDGINISHEDLSDVSDLESAVASPINDDKEEDDKIEVKNFLSKLHLKNQLNQLNSQDQKNDEAAVVMDLRQKINEKKIQQKALEDKNSENKGNKQSPSIVDELNDINKKHKNDEDALDFEAEDGECADEKEDKPIETKNEGKILIIF